MKNSILLISMFISISFLACQKEDGVTGMEAGSDLTFNPVVKDRTSISTRALGDYFFTEGGEINVQLKTSVAGSTTQSFIYTYGADKIFRGNPGFHFPLNDTYITELNAYWPTQAERNAGFATDQRLLQDYKTADWMTASHSIEMEGIMPTSAPVPLTFVRENVMLDFELVGQNTKGLDIQSLLIELQSNGQSTAYWAYCDNPNGHAELILKGGTAIFAPENYLIGRITVSDNSNYTIIFPQTDKALEGGKRYQVTLTPQGYYMNAYVMIGGWNTIEDEGIGIPFQQPTPNPDGTFTIDTPLQLITMSYLIRHYNDPASFDWPSRTYNLSSGFTITAEYAQQYIPVLIGDFLGEVTMDGQNITSLPYMDGGVQKTLELFVNE